MYAITTVTRKIWRNTLLGVPNGPYFDVAYGGRSPIAHSMKGVTSVSYDCEYVAEGASFHEIEAHVELGGYAIALREGALYALFTEQDGPGFAELWPNVTYHMVVQISEVSDGS